MTTTDGELEVFLTSLETMPLAALRVEWRTRWGPPPALRSSRLLRHLIAWRLQSAAYGDLTWDDRRRLKSASLPTLHDHQPDDLRRAVKVAERVVGLFRTGHFARLNATPYRAVHLS